MAARKKRSQPVPRRLIPRQMPPISGSLVDKAQTYEAYCNQTPFVDATACYDTPETDVTKPAHLIIYTPSCSETLLRTQAAHALDEMRLDYCWFAYVPSRIGWNGAVDAAAACMIQSHAYYMRGRKDNVTFDAALQSYSQAVRLVQAGILCPESRHSDSNILAIALLTHCEILMRNDRKAYCTHWTGIGTLLRARLDPQYASDLVRAVFYSMWDYNFRVPCSRGVESPFEDDTWLTLEPAPLKKVDAKVITLRKLSQQLLIRLPRLMVLVRSLREARWQGATIDDTLGLALELLQCHDSDAENRLLHLVTVTKTKDLLDRFVMPYSYFFNSSEDLATAVLYWQTRLMVINLCLRLASSEIVPEYYAAYLAVFDSEALRAAQIQKINNVIMSWSDAQSRGDFGTVTMTQAFVAVFGGLTERDTFRGLPTAVVRSWLVQRLAQALGKKPHPKFVEQLSSVSEQLAGGPLADWDDLLIDDSID